MKLGADKALEKAKNISTSQDAPNDAKNVDDRS